MRSSSSSSLSSSSARRRRSQPLIEPTDYDCTQRYYCILEANANTYSEVALFDLGDGSPSAQVQFVHGVRLEYDPMGATVGADRGITYRSIQRPEAIVPRAIANFGRVLSDFLAGISQWPNLIKRGRPFQAPGIGMVEKMMLPVEWRDVPPKVNFMADSLHMPESWRDRTLRMATINECDLGEALGQVWAYVAAQNAKPIFSGVKDARIRDDPLFKAAHIWQKECSSDKPLTAERMRRLVLALRILGNNDAGFIAANSPTLLCAFGAESAIASAVRQRYGVEPHQGSLKFSVPPEVFEAWSLAIQNPDALTRDQKGMLYFTAMTNDVPLKAEDEADFGRMAAKMSAIILQENVN